MFYIVRVCVALKLCDNYYVRQRSRVIIIIFLLSSTKALVLTIILWLRYRHRVRWKYILCILWLLITIYYVFEKNARRRSPHKLYRTAAYWRTRTSLQRSVWGFLLETMSERILTKVGFQCGATSRNICFYFRARGLMCIYIRIIHDGGGDGMTSCAPP